MGAGHFQPQFRRQHTPGRQHGGNAGNDDAAKVELTRQLRRVQARRAAEGKQREAARVDAPARMAWEVTIDRDAEPLAPPPLTGLVQGSQLGRFPRQGGESTTSRA